MSKALSLHQPVDDVTSAPGDSWSRVTRVKLDALHPGTRLRLGKVRKDYLALLVESNGEWPPIVIRRQDNTIIDGYYRYLAAQILCHSEIRCVSFDGPAESAFLEALRLNLAHGLPLSLKDRESAALQLLTGHQEWSDRRLGEACGLSPKTVQHLRSRTAGNSGAQNLHLNTRLGRDGKRYPADAEASRVRILRALRETPEESLRHIAEATGSSPTTVKAVKASLRSSTSRDPVHNSDAKPRRRALLSSSGWLADSGLRSTTEGAAFATWFERTRLSDEWLEFVEDIPLSRIYEIADEARRRADHWVTFASTLEGRARHH
jgi:ParB-like chromosome segregation protein Spo0J